MIGWTYGRGVIRVVNFQNGINDPVKLYCLSVIDMIIRCSVNEGALYCVMMGYTGTDTQNIILTTH